MTERITSTPEQTSVTCVQLPGQETGLARGEMANTSGGSLLPSLGVRILIEVVKIVADTIEHCEDDASELLYSW